MKDKRSRRILCLAHCLLNQNAKVEGLACFPGVHEPLVRLLFESKTGLVQLPCPEMACLGPKRPLGSDTVEQYDTTKYRAACRRLARSAVREMIAYRKAGYKIIGVLGVEGSPSCSVITTPRLVDGRRLMVRGSGLFIGALKEETRRLGLDVPFAGIPESGGRRCLAKSLETIRTLVSAK